MLAIRLAYGFAMPVVRHAHHHQISAAVYVYLDNHPAPSRIEGGINDFANLAAWQFAPTVTQPFDATTTPGLSVAHALDVGPIVGSGKVFANAVPSVTVTACTSILIGTRVTLRLPWQYAT
ncbi:MAG TPA: hypothetical protein PKA58_10595 [Polyangium sp.]|nr:hypothetical protein [Polyangium sp.]